MSYVRSAVAALLTTGLAATVVSAPAFAVPASSPAGQGGGWLSRQINAHGLVHNSQYDFDDYGLTADTVLGMHAIGSHAKEVRRAREALAAHVDDYTTYQTDRYAGATAKLLVVAQETGGSGRNFGGVDLVSRLAARVATAAPVKGRIEDKSMTDYANTIGQIFATRGLLRADHPLAPSVVRFLLKQQCDAGYFRLDFTSDKAASAQRCTASSPADTDVTALAVVELGPVAKGHPTLTRSLSHATTWLKKHQKANGSFGGGPSTSAANSNSTGLAAWALRTEGRCAAARDAARWTQRLQVTGTGQASPLAGERGAIAYDRAALASATKRGIDAATRDQWRRATAQAAPGLLALSSCQA